jgi:hypothetical protein
MKEKMSFKVYGFLALLVLTVCFGCTDKNSGTSHVEFRLTDAAADYQEVNVEIREVQINSQTGDPQSGWQAVQIKQGVYNLLKFRNGLDTLLGNIDLPAGRISQVRLILGSNNTIKIGGQVSNLTTPSGQQSGLKIQVNSDIKEGVTYTILLDFDAAKSIVATGSGKYNLKPVIRSVTEALTGAIKGKVNPIVSTPVYAIAGTDTVSTYSSATTGGFLFKGMGVGTYRLVFQPATGPLVEKAGVTVVVGSVTDVGTVQLQ